MAYMCKYFGECDACGYCSELEEKKKSMREEGEVFYDKE